MHIDECKDIEDINIEELFQEENFSSDNIPVLDDSNNGIDIQSDLIYDNIIDSNVINSDSIDSSYIVPPLFLPEVYKIYVRTWGCSHNVADGEYIRGLLTKSGFKIVDDPNDAHLWVLNSCTVKNPSEDNLISAIKQANKRNKKVVLAGCVPQAQKDLVSIQGYSVIGIKQIHRVSEVVLHTLVGHTVRMLSTQSNSSISSNNNNSYTLSLPKIRVNKYIEIIPIASGCLNQCTYCKTRFARGSLISYPPQMILDHIRSVIKEGNICEFWITAEDVGAYGLDIGTCLPDLLKQILSLLSQLAPNSMMRIGQTNPPYIIDYLSEMISILNHPQCYAHLHIPVQSGSDNVLEHMKRRYTVSDFTHIIQVLAKNVPELTFATDIICGYPTETLDDWNMTMKLCREFKIPTLNISQFYPRRGTAASKLKRIPTAEVKNRSRELTSFFNTYLPFKDRIGQKYLVMITRVSKDGNHLLGHNKGREQILVSPFDKKYLGSSVTVIIESTVKFAMFGRMCNESKSKSIYIPIGNSHDSTSDPNN